MFNKLFIPVGALWSFITGSVSLLSYFDIEFKFMIGFFNEMPPEQSLENILLFIATTSFILAIGFIISAINIFLKKAPNDLDADVKQQILKDIANGKKYKECTLWDYGEQGYSQVPFEIKWRDWISYNDGKYGLVSVVKRSEMGYQDFGNEFYFFDLDTGNKAKKETVGSYFRNGMVLRLMPK